MMHTAQRCVYESERRMRNARNSLISFYISHNKLTLFASFTHTYTHSYTFVYSP